MERICRNYIDQLEQPGGKQYNIQNFMMMYIFGSTTNTEYRTKLFDHWPTYLEDFNECKSIMGYRYPETLLEEAMQKGLYKNTFCCYVTPDTPTPIADNTYDVLLCSAGMFPGSITPQAFTELIRVVRKGGVIAWNIADGYEGFNEFFKTYDELYKQLIKEGKG